MQNKTELLQEPTNTLESRNETISELAHRHLQDESHITTDEELKNARFEFSDATIPEDTSLFEVDNSTIIPSLPGEDDTHDDKPHERSVPNPYDVLGG